MVKSRTEGLTKKNQTAVLKMFKKTPNAQKIAKELTLPRRQVMSFLESQSLAKYSEKSYL